jgi:hypothetical protein
MPFAFHQTPKVLRKLPGAAFQEYQESCRLEASWDTAVSTDHIGIAEP